MKNLATKLERDVVFQSMGTIVRIEGATFVIQTDDGDLRAARAVMTIASWGATS